MEKIVAANTEPFIKRAPKGKLIYVNIVTKDTKIRVPARILTAFWAITPSLVEEFEGGNRAYDKRCSLTHVPSGLAAGFGSHQKIIIAWNRMPNSMKRRIAHERDENAFQKGHKDFMEYCKTELSWK